MGRKNSNFGQADRDSCRADIPLGRKTRLGKRAWEVDREFQAVGGCSGRLTGITDRLTGITHGSWVSSVSV